MTCRYLNKIDESPCSSYIKPGMCSRGDMFRCIEFIEKFEPELSYSGINNFMKCPRLYYLSQIKGIEVRNEYKSDALMIGSAVDEYITKDKAIGDITELWQAKAEAVTKAFSSLFSVDKTVYIGQQKFSWQKDGYPYIRGYIDLASNDHFIEIKCTTRPEYYTNTYWIHDQLGTYFMSNPNYKYGIVWAIRTPQLRQTGNFRDESFDGYMDRCFRDMTKRASYYFTGYSKSQGVFGVKFYREEFDITGLMDRYKWLAREIKECVMKDYWYQDRTQCLSPWQCDMLSICDSGGISEDMYKYRDKGM